MAHGQRRLRGHELLPQLGRQLLGLLGHLLLQLHEDLQVALQIRAHEVLHRMAVETDDVGEHLLREQGHTGRLLLQNDLQQDGAREVLTGLGIAHDERLALHHQRLHVTERDVGRRIGVIQAAIGILLDDTHRRRAGRRRLGIGWFGLVGLRGLHVTDS
jgi:hypothetical protein